MRYLFPFFLCLVWSLTSGGVRADTLPQKPAYVHWKMVAFSSHIVLGDLELLKMQGEENRPYRPKAEDRFFPAMLTVTSLLKGEYKERQVQVWISLNKMPHLRNVEPNPTSLKQPQVILFLQKDSPHKGFYSTNVAGASPVIPVVSSTVRAIKSEIENQRKISEGFSQFWSDRVKPYNSRLTAWLENIKNESEKDTYTVNATSSINSIVELGKIGYAFLALHLTDESKIKREHVTIEVRHRDWEEGLVHLKLNTIGDACCYILFFTFPDGPFSLPSDMPEQPAQVIFIWRLYAHYTNS